MNTAEVALCELGSQKCKVYDNGDIVPLEAKKKKQHQCYKIINAVPLAYQTDKLHAVW